MARYSYDRGSRATSISASNANAAGDEFAMVFPGGKLPKNFTWTASVADGSYSALEVRLEGCNGDPDTAANWFTLDTIVDPAGGTSHVIDKTAKYVRAKKISSATSAGAPTSTVTFTATI